ncbi:MAG TPA: zf-TFIIB domain-containing protein [Bacillota bacterium]|nr:zf-TFIIB domain-containing protein [Bacillota bacterium]
MLCPVCKVELRMADRQGIEIDYCQQCRGVWLDRGELDKLIERSADDDDGPGRRAPGGEFDPRDSRDSRDPRDIRDPRRRRKSLLGQILDFD